VIGRLPVSTRPLLEGATGAASRVIGRVRTHWPSSAVHRWYDEIGRSSAPSPTSHHTGPSTTMPAIAGAVTGILGLQRATTRARGAPNRPRGSHPSLRATTPRSIDKRNSAPDMQASPVVRRATGVPACDVRQFSAAMAAFYKARTMPVGWGPTSVDRASAPRALPVPPILIPAAGPSPSTIVVAGGIPSLVGAAASGPSRRTKRDYNYFVEMRAALAALRDESDAPA